MLFETLYLDHSKFSFTAHFTMSFSVRACIHKESYSWNLVLTHIAHVTKEKNGCFGGSRAAPDCKLTSRTECYTFSCSLYVL